jgi:serine/threonine protein kinase
MELVEGGCLTELIDNCKDEFTESHIATFCKATTEGLHYLHTRPNPIVHRDIKSDNILVGLDGAIKISTSKFSFGSNCIRC